MSRIISAATITAGALPLFIGSFAHATLLVNEPFNYSSGYTDYNGDTQAGLANGASIGGPTGPTGNTSGTPGTNTPGITAAAGTGLSGSYVGATGTVNNVGNASTGDYYTLTGLTFGTGSNAITTTGGAVVINSTAGTSPNNAPNEYLSVPLGAAAQAAGGTVYGSFLYNLNTAYTVGTATTNGSQLSINVGSQFGASTAFTIGEKGYHTANYAGSTGAGAVSATNSAVEVPATTTFLALFQVSGLGTASLTTSEWLLSAAQFANFNSAGTLNATALNAATVGTGATNVYQRGTATSATSINLASDYLNLYTYEGAPTVDELRLSDTSLSEATPTPEPVSIGLLGLGMTALLARRRKTV